MNGHIDRRGFLGVGGSALICTIGGRKLHLRTVDDIRHADAAAASLKRPAAGAADAGSRKRPAAARADAVDALKFGTPEPQPGGTVREYWIQARSVKWDVAP